MRPLRRSIIATLLFTIPVGAVVAPAYGSNGAADDTPASAAKPAESETALPLCPIMGEPVDFTLKAMTDDGPIYFCCAMCIPKYKKDPAKYAEKVATQRAALEKRERTQVSCPVDAKSVDGKLTADVGGHRIAFCSKECQAQYAEHPGAHKAKLADSYTYQTRCPISGEKIQPNVFIDLSTDQRIYFCCASCGDKLLKDAAKYAPKLQEQGVMIDPKKITPGAPAPKKDNHAGHGHP